MYSARAMYEQLKQQGKCVWCRLDRDREGSYCFACLEKQRDYKKQYLEKRYASGICRDCSNPRKPDGKLCQECISKVAVKNKQRSDKAREDGLCVVCHKPRNRSRYYCDEHLEKTRTRVNAKYHASDEVKNYNRKRVKAVVASGKCVWCREINDRPGKCYCSKCAKKINEKSKALKQKRQDSGLCRDCGASDIGKYIMCARCREKQNKRNKKRIEKLRRENKCDWCGEVKDTAT